MVAKANVRNEWVDAYIESGDLSEVPEQFIEEVKARAEIRLKGPSIAVGEVEIFDDEER